jgi:hypothetical protein
MNIVQKTILAAALFASAGAYAQSPQWQVQINSQPQPAVAMPAPVPVQQAYAVQAPVSAAPTVESIQAQHDARIRWGVQRGYIAEPDYRRLMQIQANIEHNRRIAYADGYFNEQEQQFVFGQLNVLSAEIDAVMLKSNYVQPYYQQFLTPVPVWVLNNGWVNGRYEVRADDHHRRGYRPAPQPPVQQVQQVQAVQQIQQTQQGQQHQHPHRPNLRDVLDPLGIFR